MTTRKELIAAWPGSVYQKWAYNFCLRNSWRVQYVIGDQEDCMAECALTYVECRQRYGATVNTEAQFCALFKMMVVSTFNTVSTRDFKKRQGRDALLQRKPENEELVDPEARLATTLMDASDELQGILKVLKTAPQEIMDTLRMEVSDCNPKRLFTYLARLTGITDKAKPDELLQELRVLLS